MVIEDLDIADMKKSMGRKAFRRSVSDAALGQIRPQLTYKIPQNGSTLTVADRWFASSQIHHGHILPEGTPCRLEGKHRMDKHLTCPTTGQVVDRDENAAKNLRDWPGHASRGPVQGPGPARQHSPRQRGGRRPGSPARPGERT
ncbi:MAG: zinc ribbon domain-containing protein [Streptosporangiales bacterium]|nr:zinc ribbon domain-containing protein [Streptosporangiales bacterium]